MSDFNIGDKVQYINPDATGDYEPLHKSKVVGTVVEIIEELLDFKDSQGNHQPWPYRVYFPGFSKDSDDIYPCSNWEIKLVTN